MTDALTLKSITAYRNLKTDDLSTSTPPNSSSATCSSGSTSTRLSQEFQLAYSGERLTGVAGLYYLDEQVEIAPGSLCRRPARPGLPQQRHSCARSTIDLKTKSYAAFANAQLRSHARRAAFGGPSLHQGNQGLFPHHEHLLLAAAGVQLDLAFAPPRGKWTDRSPMASIDWQALPQPHALCARGQGLQIGRLQRPRQLAPANRPNMIRRPPGRTKPASRAASPTS